jgi:dihydrofolate reductase
MKKLKLAMQMTIDGFVAGPNGEADWVFLPGKQDPAAFKFGIDLAGSCDTLLIGRKSAAGFTAHWENLADNHPDSPWNPFAKLIADMRKIVFSHDLHEFNFRNIEVETGHLVTVVQELKKQSGKDLLVYGGVNFAKSLIGLNLVDEYYFIVNPVALGSGQTIFSGKQIMQLQESIAYSNGKVMNRYVPVGG